MMRNQEEDEEIICHIAASMLRNIDARLLVELDTRDVPLTDFMKGDDVMFRSITGFNPPPNLTASARYQALQRAGEELLFIRRHNIRILWITEAEYPLRLEQISGPPPLLYMLGTCDLNAGHPVSMVGTRRMTPYGAEMTRRLTADLAASFPDLLVVSGLAFGVDAVAHTTALEAGVRTVAVVAHGLDMIYPAQHRDLAKRIIKAGGAIISQYPSGTRPFRNNFLERNRIVAGMSDAIVVTESDLKGGAMSTARHAFEADRAVLAVPGRTTDQISAGCNNLIRMQRATICTSAEDIMNDACWEAPAKDSDATPQRSLFPELGEEAALICDSLRNSSDPLQLDAIVHATGLPINVVMSQLGELEFDGVVLRHPGNRYSLIG